MHVLKKENLDFRCLLLIKNQRRRNKHGNLHPAELFVFRFLLDDNGVFHLDNPPFVSKQRLKA